MCSIVGKGADYVLALKGNQASIHDEAVSYFEGNRLVLARFT